MSEPIVKLDTGLVRGTVEKHEDDFDYYSFKGIPYAEPPVGPLRFKDPVPKKPWTGVLDCKVDGPPCLQYDFVTDINTSHEEDCLYLNVFTRSVNEKNKNSPVLVIAHLGACLVGSGRSMIYGPDYLIRKDVVIVVPTHRVGVLGFLDLEDEIAPGNQGLKDVVASLEWVQKNIQMFGGDPKNVSMFGTVSGSITAHYMTLSPLTKGLIHKLIINSSSAYNVWCAVVNPKLQAIKLCSLLGKELTDSKEILKFLSTVDARKLQEAVETLRKNSDCFPFGPGVDSKSPNPFMPIHRYKMADQGVQLPCLAGYNANDGQLLLTDMTMEQFFEMGNQDFEKFLTHNSKELLSRYGLTAMQLRQLYYGKATVSHTNPERFVEFANDVYFIEGVHRLLRTQALKSSFETYTYQFSYISPKPLCRTILKKIYYESDTGPGHFDELPFFFRIRAIENKGFFALEKGTDDYRMMEVLTEMWTNFARYGKPTIGTSELIPVQWQPITDGTELRYLNIDKNLSMETTINVDVKFLSAKNIKT